MALSKVWSIPIIITVFGSFWTCLKLNVKNWVDVVRQLIIIISYKSVFQHFIPILGCTCVSVASPGGQEG